MAFSKQLLQNGSIILASGLLSCFLTVSIVYERANGDPPAPKKPRLDSQSLVVSELTVVDSKSRRRIKLSCNDDNPTISITDRDGTTVLKMGVVQNSSSDDSYWLTAGNPGKGRYLSLGCNGYRDPELNYYYPEGRLAMSIGLDSNNKPQMKIVSPEYKTLWHAP